MSEPLLSLVVPFESVDTLPHLLRSLCAQTVSFDRFEVLLVGEGDPALSSELPFRVRVVPFTRPPGFVGHTAGLKRNLAIRRADADRLVFVDADCVLSPTCLARHAADRDVCCGLARELPASVPRARLETCSHDALWVLSSRDSRESVTEAGWLHFYTCNASAPRDRVIRAGLFDGSGHRCHDLDLGYRLHLQGATFTLDPGCEVIHLEHPRSAGFRDAQAQGWAWMGEKHPELAALVADKRVTVARAQQRALDLAETRFRSLTQDLPGVRCGSTWVWPPGTPIDAALRRDVPSARMSRGSTHELFLRLEKGCWDYSFLLPAPPGEPLVSVVMAARNAEKTVRRALESVLRQREQRFELIVVDDDSDDRTAAVVARYAACGRLRLISANGHRGLANALNRALAAARGQWLLQVDADDWLEADAMARLVDIAEALPDDVAALYGGPRVHPCDGSAPRVESVLPVSTADDCLTYPRLQAPRMYRVSALRAAGGWRVDDAARGRWFEDRRMLATLAGGMRLVAVDEVLYNVSEGPGSLSRRAPLQAASAKLAIVGAHAAETSSRPDAVLTRGLLRVRAFHRMEDEAAADWSVVVPFHGCPRMLEISLRSWADTDLAGRGGELIVVADGAPATLPPLPFAARVIATAASAGPAAARNIGARAARGKMLFFSDADRILPPAVLRMHEARHAGAARPSLVVGDVYGRRAFTVLTPQLSSARRQRLLELLAQRPSELERVAEAMVLGSTLSLVAEDAPPWSSALAFACTDAWQARWGELILQHGDDLRFYPHRWVRVGAGSLSVARAHFEELGGFDESLRAMEDWDLGLRAAAAGLGVVCAAEAEPLHQVHPVSSARIDAEAKARAQIAARWPEAVAHLRRTPPEQLPPGGEQFVDVRHGRGHSAPGAVARVGRYALTFDDGPHPVFTAAVLDALAGVGAKATFFILGSRGRRFPQVLRAVIAAGHEVGVHAFHHAPWDQMMADEIAAEVDATVRVIEEAGATPRFCRPPYGLLPPHGEAICRARGLTPVAWDASPRDWRGRTRSELIAELAADPLDGRVVLLHDASGDPMATAEAVRWLVPVARRAGLRPVRVGEM